MHSNKTKRPAGLVKLSNDVDMQARTSSRSGSAATSRAVKSAAATTRGQKKKWPCPALFLLFVAGCCVERVSSSLHTIVKANGVVTASEIVTLKGDD